MRHKVQFGYQVYTTTATYTLKVQVKGDVLLVWLNTYPCQAYLMNTGLSANTRFGIYQQGDDSGCTFDGWSVKQL